ncbi:MAG: hypothetical protein WA532_13260 [Candidatus Korobacteraceae bacterium]
MKAVATGKTKQWVAIALVLAAVFMVARAFLSNGGAPQPVAVATAPAQSSAAPAEESLDPRLHLNLLASSEAIKYEGDGRNIFRAGAAAVAIPPVKVSPLLAKQQQEQAAKAAQALANIPPPINLKFFGFSNKPGETPKAFLSQGDDVWIAREGDVVDRHYKIVHISPTAVEVEDLLNSNRQSIRLTQG